MHVHLREPGFAYKETIDTGTMAAAAGGFTTIMAMPNVQPYPDSTEVMEAYLQKIEADAHVHVIPYATITKAESGKEVVDMAALAKMGVRAFSDDGVGVQSGDVMEEAMKQSHALGTMIVAHTEDMSYRKPGAYMHEGTESKARGVVGHSFRMRMETAGARPEAGREDRRTLSLLSCLRKGERPAAARIPQPWL